MALGSPYLKLPPPSDVAYNAASWNANSDAATKNALRDKVETMDAATGSNTTHRGLASGNPHSVTPTEVGSDYDDISGNDGNTDVTGAELEELTDSSETVLHSHAGFVERSDPGAVDFRTGGGSGTITSQNDFHCIDSAADFVALGVRVGDWIVNWSHGVPPPGVLWAQVTNVTTIDLTLDTNIFADDDGNVWVTYGDFKNDDDWNEIDLDSITGGDVSLVKVKLRLKEGSTTSYLKFRTKGDTGVGEFYFDVPIVNRDFYYYFDIVPDGDGIIEYRNNGFVTAPLAAELTVTGWWA